MKTVIVYHSIDLDGWISAAIVKYWFLKQYPNFGYNDNKEDSIIGINLNKKQKDILDFIGYNYGRSIPDLFEYDKVIMSDISFPKEEMLKLAKEKQSNFIWIDHHQRTINETIQYLKDNDILESNGIRTEEGQLKAACELTWEYFFPNKKMPEIVRLLGRYDCFGGKGTDEWTKIKEFQYGARAVIGNYDQAYIWLQNYETEITYPINNNLAYIYEKGKAIYQYVYTEAKQFYKNGFAIEFDNLIDTGNVYYNHPVYRKEESFKFICFNKDRFNPINFDIDYHADGYDGVACFYYDGTSYSFSLYNDNGLVDCSIIAKQFGGGGHRSASGFKCNKEQFLHITKQD